MIKRTILNEHTSHANSLQSAEHKSHTTTIVRVKSKEPDAHCLALLTAHVIELLFIFNLPRVSHRDPFSSFDFDRRHASLQQISGLYSCLKSLQFSILNDESCCIIYWVHIRNYLHDMFFIFIVTCLFIHNNINEQ